MSSSTADTDPVQKSGSPRWIGDLWILAAIVVATLGLMRVRYHDRYVEFRRIEVGYSPNVPKPDALRLARVFADSYADGRRKLVRLNFVKGRHEFLMNVDQELAEQYPDEVVRLERGIRKVWEEALPGRRVVVWLGNEDLQPHTLLFESPE